MPPDQCREQILNDFGSSALRDLCKCIGRNYPRAHRESHDQFAGGVARDVYPHLRRALIEAGLPTLQSRHPHITVVGASNKADNSHFHRLSSGRSVLTVSRSNSPKTLPADADFRRTLARHPQRALNLFGDMSEDDDSLITNSDAVYGVVVHGPDLEQADTVAFLQILIPDRTGTRVLANIDLFHFWDEDNRPTEFPTVPIIPQAPTLKVGTKRVAEES